MSDLKTVLLPLATLPRQPESYPALLGSAQVLFSIQLSSNRPEQVVKLLENIEQTAMHPEQVEVLIHIDSGDEKMENLLIDQKAQRKVKVKYLATDLVKGFTHLWKAYNPLFKLTDPGAYFVTLFSDEMRFTSQKWDVELMRYAGYYPDHVFRIRGSRYRFRNYTDYWECGFAPDSLAFYTRDWLALQGDWNPCTGPDSFQQCVSFYLFTNDPFSHTQYMRDIPAPFIEFGGEGASMGLEGEAKKKRIRDNNHEWFSLMSPAMQQNAKCRAMHLKAAIMVHEKHRHQAQDELCIYDEPAKRRILVINNRGQHIETLPYGVSYWRVRLTNAYRAIWVHYYAGGGGDVMKSMPWRGMRMMVDTYCPFGRRLLEYKDSLDTRWINLKHKYLIHIYNHMRGRIKEAGLVKGSQMLLKDVWKRCIK